MAFVPLHVRTARSMTRGLVACAIVAVWAFLKVADTGTVGDHDARSGDYEEILLAAVFSGAAMCGALSVVSKGRSSATTSRFVIAMALGLPYLLGVYLGLYRGLWGATDLFVAPSLLVVVRTVALTGIGYALVTVARDLTHSVQQRPRSRWRRQRSLWLGDATR
jgi:hypothetical protein